jgi:hypothetical protein
VFALVSSHLFGLDLKENMSCKFPPSNTPQATVVYSLRTRSIICLMYPSIASITFLAASSAGTSGLAQTPSLEMRKTSVWP